MKHLQKWTRPGSYIGKNWPEYYVFLSQNRDSDALTRANFDAGLKELGGESNPLDDLDSNGDPIQLVQRVKENHWLCGWVEWIAIHKSATDKLALADGILADLENYPVVNEELWSEYEQADAELTWANCYTWRDRIEYIRKYRSQFEPHDFADLLNCVRGKYFLGYASELLC